MAHLGLAGMTAFRQNLGFLCRPLPEGTAPTARPRFGAGEGRLDSQSFEGNAPAGVLRPVAVRQHQ